MTERDIPSGLALCRAAGWNQTQEDWEFFIGLDPNGSFVAVGHGGEVLGTVATIRYGASFSWIGMVLVDPAHQRKGIGNQLLREALRYLSNEETVKLDATPAGRQVYLPLGFTDEYSISRLILDGEQRKIAPVSAEPRRIEARDLPAILAMDLEIFGARREAILRSLLARAPELAWIIHRDGRPEAYCFGRLGHNFAHIGPVVSRSFNDARAVVTAALVNTSGRPVVVDALHHSAQWTSWLQLIGFAEQRPLVRMYKGVNAFPGRPADQFAIAGPEFG